jgi:threonine/homoserine/homoserine lactone efflux protein
MTFELLLGLTQFAFVTSITPGPNNVMLMASGVNFGLRRTVPHMAGIFFGFTSMIALIGLGVSAAFDALPWLDGMLKAFALVYMLWLAWRVANAAPPVREKTGRARPLTAFQAAAFQWVNPKGWAMALGANAAYAPTHDLRDVLIVTAVFGVINLPAAGSWAVIGTQLTRLLQTPKWLRVFNWGMAAFLLISLIPVLTA